MTDMEKLDKMLADMQKRSIDWLQSQDNKERVFDRSYSEKIIPFIDSGGAYETVAARLVPLAMETISVYHLVLAERAIYAENKLDLNNLATFALCEFWSKSAAFAARSSRIGGGGAGYLPYDLVLWQLFITLGWKDHAARFAENCIGMHKLDLLGDPFPYEVLPEPMQCLSVALMIDRHGQDWPSDWEPEIEEMGPYGELLDIWKTADNGNFTKTLNAAADEHIDDCGFDDVEFKITVEKWWLFPVELFAFCRLREWHGFPRLKLDHPLFTATRFRELLELPSVPIPELDPRLQRTLELYVDASEGALDLDV